MRRTKRLGRAVSAGLSMVFGVLAGAGVIHADHTVQDAETFASARPFDSVGQFIARGGSHSAWAGSGVYLGDGWVLTAAHVAEGARSMSFRIAGQQRDASATYLFPRWGQGTLLNGHDLALVRLDADLPTVTAATRLTTPGDNQRVAAAVGFGRTGDAVRGWDAATPLSKRGGRNVIDRVLNHRVLLMDLDSGLSQHNALGSPNPQPLEYLIAPGDSGGGLFVYDSVDAQWKLAGVHSFGWGVLDGSPNSSYGDVSGHTRILYYNRWIDRVLADDGAVSPRSGQTVSTRLYRVTALSAALVPEPAFGAAASLAGVLLMMRGRRRGGGALRSGARRG